MHKPGKLELTATQARTREINMIQRFYPGTRRQRTAHGIDRWSVQLFDKHTGQLVADMDLIGVQRRKGWKPLAKLGQVAA